MKHELVQVPSGELEIRQQIKTIRGIQVMLDRDLAELYGVQTKQLKRQVKRNIRRFPRDFMIELSERDMKSLRCQIGTSNRGGDRYGAYAFTEQGIAMLSSILRSERAIDVNISIMRAFVAIRRFVSDHAGLVQRVGAIELKQLETDKRLDTVFDALDRSKLLPCGILPANSEYDSIRMVSRLVGELSRSPSHHLHDPRPKGDRQTAVAGAMTVQWRRPVQFFLSGGRAFYRLSKSADYDTI